MATRRFFLTRTADALALREASTKKTSGAKPQGPGPDGLLVDNTAMDVEETSRLVVLLAEAKGKPDHGRSGS